MFFFFSSRRRHTRWPRDWSSDVCSSDLGGEQLVELGGRTGQPGLGELSGPLHTKRTPRAQPDRHAARLDRLGLNSGVLQTVELALEGHRVFGPQAAHDLELLLEPGTAPLELSAEHGE